MRRLLVFMICVLLLDCAPVRAEEGKLIAMTFDDGPGAYTEQLLDGLSQRGAKATFFILGCNAQSYPQVLRRAYEEGHQIGNHTYSHKLLTQNSRQQVAEQLAQTEQILNSLCGEGNHYAFRPPFGEYSKAVLAAADSPVISWTVDPLDWKVLNAQKVEDCIVQNAFDGAIVLSHDIYESTVDGVLRAIDRLSEQGYEFVTVSELFRRRGMPMRTGKVYSCCRPTGIQLPSVEEPLISVQTATDGVRVEITAQEGTTVYYTTDGTTPTAFSSIYEEPIILSQSCTVTAVAVYDFNGGRSRPSTATVVAAETAQ